MSSTIFQIAKRVPFLVATLALGLTFFSAPAAARIPGGSGPRPDCYSEFDGISVSNPGGLPPRVECTDGDPTCDHDGVCGNGFCVFEVRLCINQNDPEVPICRPAKGGLASIDVLPKQFQGDLTAGLDLKSSACGAFVGIPVGVRHVPNGLDKPGRTQLRVTARAFATPSTDKDRVMLFCNPRPPNNPCPAVTTTTAPPPTTTSTTGPPVTTTTISSTTTSTTAAPTTTTSSTTSSTVSTTTTSTAPVVTTTTTAPPGTTTTTTAPPGTTTTTTAPPATTTTTAPPGTTTTTTAPPATTTTTAPPGTTTTTTAPPATTTTTTAPPATTTTTAPPATTTTTTTAPPTTTTTTSIVTTSTTAPPVTTTTVTTTSTTVTTIVTTTTSTTTTTTAPPVTTTTTTTSTTTTTIGPVCSCAGGAPTKLSFTTSVGQGVCGNLQNDGGTKFFDLLCGGLYFGGAGVGVPLPSVIPDQGNSLINASCNDAANPGPTTLTLRGTTPTEAGGNRCSGGSNHGGACTTNANCPGGVCKLLKCTSVGCLFGPPLPIPNSSHNGAATSTCVINTVSSNAIGTADCTTGATDQLNLPLTSGLFLTADLLANRCAGGSTPGAACGGACSTGTSACPGGGTCTNDTGRCASNGANCCSDADCAGSTCETGACVAGTNAGKGCITTADCPGSTCRTFIQPCPICNATSNKCNGGPNDGLACTPGDSAVNGDYPTSHDCPPPSAQSIGSLPIGFALTSGTRSVTATNFASQTDTFCGFCGNSVVNTFKNPAVPCTADASCSAVTGFTKCRQRTSGAFTADDVARTINVTGSPAGALTTGGPSKSATLVTVFCIPPTFTALVDSAADLPGPGATMLLGTTQLLP